MNQCSFRQVDQTGWLSAYLFTKEPLDDLLCRLVKPFLDEAFGDYVSQYFFIRYYENGPHIRLRLKGDLSTLEKIAKPKLIQAATDYFSSALSEKDGSVEFNTYKPELERYGGLAGTKIAEKLFQVSSITILHILSGKTWNFQKAIGAALILIVIQLFYFFVDRTEIRAFLEFEHNNWLQFSIGSGDDRHFVRDLSGDYAQSYARQSHYISEVLQNVWLRLENGVPFGDKNMDQWKNAIHEIYVEFKHYENEIISKSAMTATHGVDISPYDLKKWILVDSYMHMTNNRLGLLYIDEGYTYFILKNFFSEAF